MKRALYAVTVLAAGAVSAADKTLLMIDASSSMKTSDPQNLRRVAAQLYVDLASPGDQISVMEFDGKVRPKSQGFVEVRDDASREKLKAAVLSLGAGGEASDFSAAWGEVAQHFSGKGDEEGHRYVVFLTDGPCVPVDDASDAKLSQEALAQRCHDAVRAHLKGLVGNVGVAVVGLSSAAPKAFLEEMAKSAGTVARLTDKADGLPALFAQIHATHAGAKRVSVGDKNFNVDDQVARLQFLVMGEKSALTFTSADGTAFKEGDAAIEVVKNERYQLYTLKNPVKGAWAFASDKPVPAAAVMALETFNVGVDTDFPKLSLYGSEVTLKAWMTNGGTATITNPEFSGLHQFFLDVTDSAGKATTHELKAGADGRFAANVKMDKLGVWQIVARIEPGTNGSVARRAPVKTMTVVAPLLAQVEPPVVLNGLMVGEPRDVTLDLAALKFATDELTMKVQLDGAAVNVRPEHITLTRGQTTAQVTFQAWEDAKEGDFSGELSLLPKTEPYHMGLAPKISVKGHIKSSKAWVVGLGILGLLTAVITGLYFMKKRNVPSVVT